MEIFMLSGTAVAVLANTGSCLFNGGISYQYVKYWFVEFMLTIFYNSIIIGISSIPELFYLELEI